MDGVDDNDHDGVSNQFEVNRPDDWVADAIVGFPLAPTRGRTRTRSTPASRSPRALPLASPINYYQSDEVPPVGPNPPAGYPDVHPATPDG